MPTEAQLTAGSNGPFVAASGVGAAITPTRYVGGVSGASPATGTFITGDFVLDVTLATVWICTAGGSPGTWVQVTAGSGAVSSVFGRTGTVVATSGDYTVGQVTGAAPLASPALTGTPTAPTASALDDSTKVATTAYADTAVGVETTRAEAAEALKAPLASPALTGTPTAPTKTALTNNTDIATTAYTDSAVGVETTRAEAAEALALAKANNLSDVASAGVSRFNLHNPIQGAVQAVAVANVNIASAPASLDGYSFTTSGTDTLLLTAQSTTNQNGVWKWNGAGSALTRATDFPSAGSVTTGRVVQVEQGTVYAGSIWSLAVASNAPITIDTTAQTWTEVVGGGPVGSLVYNALNYGVVADGSTDDTAAWNTLFATILAAGGGTAFLPAGKTSRCNGALNPYPFSSSSTVSSGLRICGGMIALGDVDTPTLAGAATLDLRYNGGSSATITAVSGVGHRGYVHCDQLILCRRDGGVLRSRWGIHKPQRPEWDRPRCGFER